MIKKSDILNLVAWVQVRPHCFFSSVSTILYTTIDDPFAINDRVNPGMSPLQKYVGRRYVGVDHRSIQIIF